MMILTLPIHVKAQNEYGLPAQKILSPAEFGKAYDARCMKTFFQNLSVRTRTEFCACTAAQAERALSPEQQQTLATGQGTPIDDKKMTLDIVVPCLDSAVEEMRTAECLKDSSDNNFFKTRDAFVHTCQCVGHGMANYIRTDGLSLMGYLIASYPHTAENPLDSIFNAIDFRATESRVRNRCLNIYAYH